MKKHWFWEDWGLVARLMLAVGVAVVVGGLLQSTLLVIEGASDSSARLEREMKEMLSYLAPIVADQALTGDYAAIEQTLKKQVKRTEVEELWWTDTAGRTLRTKDISELAIAPSWFRAMVNIDITSDTSVDVEAGGVSYGKLHGKMLPAPAQNRLWKQFVKQLQIVIATLFLMLQFIWLIVRGNLSTLRGLANGANKFSQGDHAVRITAEGAPEVRLAAEAFNNMATNTETLLTSLSQSESKNRLLATIVEQSSEAIWTTDLDGVVTSWNAGAAAMFGYSASEAMGASRRIGTGTQAAEDERKLRLLKLEKFSYEMQENTKSGEPIDIQVSVAPLLGDTGQCIGKIAVARDITERNRSEEALRAARAAAESASQAKSGFLARMSHEIRTPMNGVLGMTELLLETELSSTQRKYAETVHRSGTNLLGIINDVLDFSKIEAGKLELEAVNFDLRRTVEDVVDMLAERAHSKGLELACQFPPDMRMLMVGDALRLGQVLTNLTGNAIKFTKEGSVLLSVSCIEEGTEKVKMRFDVKDTGQGIPLEAQARIFEEFSQADGSTTRKHGGSGLGLAISRQLVEMMNGTLHVESVPGAGATFWFTAEFMKQPEAEDINLNTLRMSTLIGVRALIVESSALTRGILRAQVSSWGMTTRIADSPESALGLLQHAVARGVPFDMVIVDIGFSGGDPLALARTIKSEPKIAKVKIVVLAPMGNHAAIAEALGAGVDTYLIKPVRQSALYDALVNVMSGKRTDAPRGIGSAAVGAQSRSGSVLLVEDNLVNQAVAMGMLSKLLDTPVTVANHGGEAIDAWSKGKFDLILMDCHMPEVDGYQATREIRKLEAASGKRVPIIAVTANAMAQDREDCFNAGMDDHLGKPFSRQQILEVLDRWLPRGSAAPTKTAAMAASPVAPPSSDGVIDHRMLDQLRDLQSKDDPDLLARVLKLYVGDSPKEMAKIAQAMTAGDATVIERAAHTLKSTSANVGAATMSKLCAEMQAAGRSGNFDAARELFPNLTAEHQRVQTALHTELAATSQS
jgi:PAS domain S-box-containing protein